MRSHRALVAVARTFAEMSGRVVSRQQTPATMCVVTTYEVALVLLVDSSGAVLMQHRNDQTSVSQNL